MPSTYSTNLAIELPGTGDQAGTWGATTNTNLGTLIEQAISGYVTQAVATGTDTTITIPNGATGVARNMCIELTGTGGTNTNLIVPANKKLYFIFNNTSSGQVTVKVSGQTGVSVPNGRKMILVSNGTDIVTAENYIASLSTDNLSCSTVTVSGTSTFSAGTASAPAATTTGDTNTGIYFPAADQVAITTGGTVAAAFNSNGLFFRNRIINGDMRIDQRNAGAAVTINSATNTYTLDRWNGFGQAADGVFTVTQSSVAPAGFVNSALVTVTTADTSLGATQTYSLNQPIEGTNVADLGYGTAAAATVTLSFWVRSSVTGTFGGAVTNSAGNRAYPFTYAISSANTWEQKSVTISGDTTGTWLTTTGIGLYLRFSLGAGSSVSATAGAWTSTASVVSATGATNLMATNGATFYITGVQLETGSVATPFERRPYGTELNLCYRYYLQTASINLIGSGATGCVCAYSFPVPMRTSPSISLFRGTTADQIYRNSDAAVEARTWTIGITPNQIIDIYNFSSTFFSAGTGFQTQIKASAEL